MTKDRTQTHQRENNEESEQHLQENQVKFSKQCLKVLELLYQGKRLTTYSAPGYGILSLPRRILDLKENGVQIDDRWLTDDKGKRTVKEWFINFKTDTKKDVARRWQKKIDEGKSKWVQPDLL